MKIVAISDTHNKHKKIKLPDGDLLIHAGDFTSMGRISEVKQFAKWWFRQDFKYKILIAGNHDFFCEREPDKARDILENVINNCYYLLDQEIKINGIKFYGSPWQPWFHNWAFNLDRGEEIKEKWDKIPEDTNILITHGPPYGYGDKTERSNINVGCEELIKRVKKINPKYHIFGHIHEGYGVYNWLKEETTFINASCCNLQYLPINDPIVFEA